MKGHISFSFAGQRLPLFCAILMLTLDAASQDKADKSARNTYAPVSIQNTEMRPIHSAVLNQDMLLYIKLPAAYYASPHKSYPALYMTDANYGFPMVANFLSLYEIPGTVMPEVCLIGIGYQINNFSENVSQWSAWRTRDLTPPVPEARTAVKPQEETGGAAKFLEYIVKEVFPFVESNYRVSSTGRGLAGYSYGGLFSLYVLLKQPELFSNYFAGSPSIEFGDRILFDYEKEYASSHKDLKAHLFMTYGGDEGPEMISGMKKMADVLQFRKYPGLKIQTHIFPDEKHVSGTPASVMRAITALYLPPARKEIQLSPQVLARYVGVYEIRPGLDMTITHEESQLFSTVTGQLKVPLFAETETKFFFKAVEAQCEFIKDDKGVITHAVLLPAKMKAQKK